MMAIDNYRLKNRFDYGLNEKKLEELDKNICGGTTVL